ncbi:peptidyl-tRNA hydrolase II family protein, partial [Striga asiatica]
IQYSRRRPQPLVEGLLHALGDDRRPAERARLLIVVHPAVQAAPVEYVPTVRQPPDLVLASELVQAHRAALRRPLRQIREPHHRERLADERRRHRSDIRPGFVQCGVRRHRFKLQVGVPEPEEREDGGREFTNEFQKRQQVDEQFGEKHVGVTHRKTHFPIGDGNGADEGSVGGEKLNDEIGPGIKCNDSSEARCESASRVCA